MELAKTVKLMRETLNTEKLETTHHGERHEIHNRSLCCESHKAGGAPKFVSKTPRALTLICRRVLHFDNNPALRASKYRHSGTGDAGAV